MTTTSNKPGCFGLILKLFGLKVDTSQQSEAPVDYLSEETTTFPYRLRDDFLSPAEKSFYQVLRTVVGERYVVCPKVSLADVFFVVRPNENKSAYNRINRKHVDFLACEPNTMRPMFAIELDDRSHERQDRIERDEFVNKVFQAAELPLMHIPARASYSTSELEELISSALRQENASNGSITVQQSGDPVREVQNANTPPECPKCGIPMVLRTAKTGDQAGRQFYGCANYPRCRVVLPYNPS